MAFRNQFTNLMQRDLYGWFFEDYNKLAPVYPQIYDVVNVEGGFEKNTTGIGMGRLSVRKESDQIVASNPLEGFTVTSKVEEHADSFFLTATFVKDTPSNKIANIMQTLAGTWADGLIQSKETYAALPFNNGGLTAGHEIFNGTITGVVNDPSGDLAYDGKPFFNLTNNTRTNKNGDTFFNAIASNLTSDNLQTLYNLMTNTNNRDERGDKIALIPDTLVIPAGLRFTAKNILEADHILGSGNNDINVTKNIVTPIEWQYLTDTDAWFLGKRMKGIKFMERQAPVIDFFQDEIDKKFYATIEARWGLEINNWRYWGGSNLSTS